MQGELFVATFVGAFTLFAAHAHANTVGQSPTDSNANKAAVQSGRDVKVSLTVKLSDEAHNNVSRSARGKYWFAKAPRPGDSTRTFSLSIQHLL